jgi:hypothetical protein
MSRTVVTGKTIATNPTIQGNATFNGTEGLTIPIGSTAERPTIPSEGVIRYNATTGKFEGYSKDPNDVSQTIWGSLGGGALLDLSDIDESGLSDGNSLKWNSTLTKFVPTAGGTIENIIVSGQSNLTIPSSGDLEMVSGAGIVLTTDPSNGKLTIASTTQANLSVDVFTADGSTNEFTLTRVPPTPTDILVFVDSLYQAPSSYTIVGTNPAKLVFPDNVPNTLDITVTFLNLDTVQATVQDGSITPAKLSSSTYYIDTFYGDASTKTFTLSQIASTANQLLVIINGIIQNPGADNAYSVTGTQITFTTAPAYNALIKVRFLGATFSTASSISPNAVGLSEMDIGGSGTAGQVLGLGSSGGLIWISPASADFIYNNQTFTNASSVEFNVASGFTLTEGNPGVLTVGFSDYLTTVSVTGQPTISIDSSRELEFIAGPGVTISTDNTIDDKKITWSVSVGGITEDILPISTSTYDLGSTSKVWDTVYTNTIDLGNITLSDISGVLSLPHSIKFGGANPFVLTATANGLEFEKLTIGTPAQVLAGEHVTLTATIGKLNLPAENIGLPELDVSNSGTAGQYLSTTGSALQWTTGLTQITAGTGLLVQGGGSSITTTGTIIVDPQISQDALQGVVAYGWGNHTSAGYLTDVTSENLTNLIDVNTGTLNIGQDGWALVWDHSSSKFIVADMLGNWLTGTVAGSVYYGGGRVGIGTNTPAGFLHINQQESNPSDPLIVQDGAYRPLYIPAGGVLTTQTGIHLETDYTSLVSPTAPITGGIIYFKNGEPYFVSSSLTERSLITPAGFSGIIDNSTSIAITIDSSENVTLTQDLIVTGTISAAAITGDAFEGISSSELRTATSQNLQGTYTETLMVADDYVLTGDVTLTGNFFTSKLTDDGIDITISDDGEGDRTITGAGAFVAGSLADGSSWSSVNSGSIKIPYGTTAERGTENITGAFRFNTTDASFEGYDGLEWGAIGGGGSSENAYAKETFIATANQTTFTLTNKYTPGYIEVYLNGVKLVGGSGNDFTATSTGAPYTVVLATGAALNDVIQTIAFTTFVVVENTMATETFTATANQTTFTLADSYTVGYIQVYLNGVKLLVGVDVTASDGATIVLIDPADVGDAVQTVAYGTFASADHYLKSETYTQAEVNTNTYTKTQVDTNTYTKTQVDTNTYTQTQVDALLHTHATSASFAQTRLTSGLILG